MTSVGFTNYPSEWWHYDYGDLFWAAEAGADCALFGGVFDEVANENKVKTD